MGQEKEIIIRELDKNPDISITDLEGMTELPIGEVCKIRYFWRLEKKREGKRYGTCQVIGKIKDMQCSTKNGRFMCGLMRPFCQRTALQKQPV